MKSKQKVILFNEMITDCPKNEEFHSAFKAHQFVLYRNALWCCRSMRESIIEGAFTDRSALIAIVYEFEC